MAEHGGTQLAPQEQVEVSEHMGWVIGDCVSPSCGLLGEIRAYPVSIEEPQLSYLISNRRAVRMITKRLFKARVNISPDILQRRRQTISQSAPAGT